MVESTALLTLLQEASLESLEFCFVYIVYKNGVNFLDSNYNAFLLGLENPAICSSSNLFVKLNIVNDKIAQGGQGVILICHVVSYYLTNPKSANDTKKLAGFIRRLGRKF